MSDLTALFTWTCSRCTDLTEVSNQFSSCSIGLGISGWFEMATLILL